MEFKELLEEIKGLCENSVYAFAYVDYDTNDVTGDVEEVEHYGGEDCGSTWYSVQYFPKHDIYIRVDGWYQSYNGVDFNGWDDCKQVVPRKKEIIVFE